MTVKYQAQVTVRKTGRLMAIGPVVEHDKLLYPMVEAINLNVLNGKEKNWTDAKVVRVHGVGQQ